MYQKPTIVATALMMAASAVFLAKPTACDERAASREPAAAEAHATPANHVFDRWDGKGKVDLNEAPTWWPSTAADSERVLRSLPGVEVFEIGRSAGGHRIIAAAWGEREDLPGRTSRSLASSISGGSASAFYGKGQRKRQSFLFIGNAHGLEIEGTVAGLNMLSVVATGKDLRGRAWPRLKRQGRELRIVLIPHLNMDGRMRYPDYRHFLGVSLEEYRRIFFGNWKDGRELDWPKAKLAWPIPVHEVSPLGVYFNDHGVNLVYDTGLGIEPQPETKALLSFLRKEMPDCALLSHSDAGSLVQPPDAFVPERYRQRQSQIGALVGARCKREGAKVFRIPETTQSYAGEVLYQSDLVYHSCGALPLIFEFPCGYKGSPGTFDEILDVGMYALEEILSFGVEYRFRPADPRP